jgi:hypothetical protein
MVLRKNLFWEYDVDTMDMDENKFTIIPRVLERGMFEDWQYIRSYYGDEVIKEILLKQRYIDKVSLNFVSKFYQIPEEQFRCYTQRQLNLPHWDY